MSLPRILIQLDPDKHASVFDSVVAIDSGVDHLLQYTGVEPDDVRSLVHGALFTRRPAELQHTAIFIGGSSVSAGQAILREVQAAFFGPMRCSVMFDGHGANTTAVAAVLSAGKHVSLAGSRAVVLGGTGPVGGRVGRLVAGQGGQVCLVSRERSKAEAVCQQIANQLPNFNVGSLQPCATGDEAQLRAALSSADVVFACGAAGIELLGAETLSQYSNIKVAIDLNAVPPAGIAGIGAMDKASVRGQRIDYGAVGVGSLKMKIHKAAIGLLFTRHDAVLDTEEILAIGRSLQAPGQ